MEVIRSGAQSLPRVAPDAPRSAITVGNFDGLHTGHQRLLLRLCEAAAERQLTASVVTFEPHPQRVIAPNRPLALLTPLADKLLLLDRLGVERTVVLEFTDALRATDSATFVQEILVSRLRVGHMVVGPDTRFGADQGGGLDQLARLGALCDFTAEAVAAIHVDGTAVSSSLIRAHVQEGAVAAAAELLGRPFRLRGDIVRGHQRGRHLGFPTANLAPRRAPGEADLVPADGVYAGRLWVGPDAYAAVVNVGRKPTFGPGGPRIIEAHLLDFRGDLYGADAALDFIARLRDEQRFSDAPSLAAQIGTDVAAARRLLGAYHGD